jgi:hypothetical protein
MLRSKGSTMPVGTAKMPVISAFLTVAVCALALVLSSGSEAGELLGAHSGRSSWAPALAGLVAGLALSELIRFLFRCVAYGWFTLWFSSVRLMQYAAFAGIAAAVVYFK